MPDCKTEQVEEARDGEEENTPNSKVSRGVPDGGYGWWIVVGTALANITFSVPCLSFGVIYLQLLDRYRASAVVTAGIGALNQFSIGLFSPLSTSLATTYGNRLVTAFGGVLCALGALTTAFAPNIAVTYVTFGLINGIGCCMIYSTGFVIINEYFDMRRARAMGLASLGTAAGAFLFPPVVQTLFDTYGFQGTFLIIAAMMGNTFVSAALYRPLKEYKSVMSCFATRSRKEDWEVKSVENHKDQIENVTDNEKCVDLINGDIVHINNENKIKAENEIQNNLTKKNSKNAYSSTIKKPSEKEKIDMPVKEFSEDHTKAIKFRIKLTNFCKKLGIFLLKDMGFAGFCFLSISVNFMLTTAMGFLPALAVDRGINQLDAALLLSIAGAANMAAVLPIGWLMDLPAIRTRRPCVYTALTAVVAATLLVIPLMQTFTGFAVVCVIRGAMAGVVTGQKGTLTADVLGPHRAAQGIGILFLTGSIATLSGRSLAGIFKDTIGSYDGSFYMSGAIGIFACTVFISVLQYQRHTQRKEKDRSVKLETP